MPERVIRAGCGSPKKEGKLFFIPDKSRTDWKSDLITTARKNFLSQYVCHAALQKPGPDTCVIPGDHRDLPRADLFLSPDNPDGCNPGSRYTIRRGELFPVDGIACFALPLPPDWLDSADHIAAGMSADTNLSCQVLKIREQVGIQDGTGEQDMRYLLPEERNNMVLWEQEWTA
jgi:hypothetical protein